MLYTIHYILFIIYYILHIIYYILYIIYYILYIILKPAVQIRCQSRHWSKTVPAVCPTQECYKYYILAPSVWLQCVGTLS